MTPCDDFVDALEAAILTPHSPLDTLLPQMLFDIFPCDRVSALVGTGDAFVGTSLSRREMTLDSCHVPRPLTALLLMRAVNLELVYPLLEVNISEMVEAWCAAIRAGVVRDYTFLYAALAIVLATADHLSWVLQHFVAHFAIQLIGNLPCKLE